MDVAAGWMGFLLRRIELEECCEFHRLGGNLVTGRIRHFGDIGLFFMRSLGFDHIAQGLAERIHADCIITRNIRDFRASRVIAFTPSEYLARI